MPFHLPTWVIDRKPIDDCYEHSRLEAQVYQEPKELELAIHHFRYGIFSVSLRHYKCPHNIHDCQYHVWPLCEVDEVVEFSLQWGVEPSFQHNTGETPAKMVHSPEPAVYQVPLT